MRRAAALLNCPHFLPFVLLALIGRQIQQEQEDEASVQGTAGGAGDAGRGAGDVGGARVGGGGNFKREQSHIDVGEE